MALYNKAQYRPLGSDSSSYLVKMDRYDVLCLHTMVGSLGGVDSYFRQEGYKGVESHFGVGHDGTTYQWVDTKWRADANYKGNHRIISVETADRGTGFPHWSGSDVPAWTSKQQDSIVDIMVWAHRTYGIPLELVPDSKSTRRGIGYHRQGVDPWRVSGGELWSSSRGKVCPGDRRIAQIPTLIERAKEIVNKPEITYTTKGYPKELMLSRPASLWNFNFTKWSDAQAIKDYPEGHIVRAVAEATNQVGGKYVLTEYSYSKGVENGFNFADTTPYKKPVAEPTPEPVEPETPPETHPDPIDDTNARLTRLEKLVELLFSVIGTVWSAVGKILSKKKEIDNERFSK